MEELEKNYEQEASETLQKKENVRISINIDKKTEKRLNIILMNLDNNLSQKENLAQIFTEFVNAKFEDIKEAL